MKFTIENLKAKMQGFKMNIYQDADALNEFNSLLEYIEELEQLNLARVVLPKGTFYCYDKNNKDTIKRCDSQCDECIKIEGT